MKHRTKQLIIALAFSTIAVTLVTTAQMQGNKQVNRTELDRAQQIDTLRQESYLTRELSAPPAARQKLAQLRQRIKEHNLGFEVGYTYAMERGAASVTGGELPTNLLEVARKHNVIARQVTQIDRDARDRAVKIDPRLRSRLPELSTACFANETFFDWRRSGKVTPVRTQQCGNCWAYGAMAVLESSYLIRNNLGIDGSEQFIVSNSGAGSCKGGGTKKAMDFLVSTGTTTEAALPDSGKDGKPDLTDFSIPYKGLVSGFVSDTKVIPDVAEIKAALCEHGPVVSWVGVTDSFAAYTGPSVYKDTDYAAEKKANKPCPSSGPLNGAVCGHYVTIIGWNDARNAWLVKNSWGTNWGDTGGFGTERGYMWIDYGTNQIGAGSMWVDAVSMAYQLPARYYELMRQMRPINPETVKPNILQGRPQQPQTRRAVSPN